MNHSVLHLALLYMFFETTSPRSQVGSENNPVGDALSGGITLRCLVWILEEKCWDEEGGL